MRSHEYAGIRLVGDILGLTLLVLSANLFGWPGILIVASALLVGYVLGTLEARRSR
jgi:hypothetical protein